VVMVAMSVHSLIFTHLFSSIFVADFTPESCTQHQSTEHDLADQNGKQHAPSASSVTNNYRHHPRHLLLHPFKT